jgi:hypothetical protein
MVTPLDRAQNILQSNATERVQQVQQQHPDMQQRYFDIQLSQERKKMLQKVKESEEMERARIKEEEGRRQRKDQQKDNDTAIYDLDKEASINKDQRSHIDIKA